MNKIHISREDWQEAERIIDAELSPNGHAAEDEPQKHFDRIPFAEIKFNGAEEWRVKGLLPKQGVAAFFGAKSSLKSFGAQDLGFHIAVGWNWAGRRVAQCDVVYIAAEGAAGFKKRKHGFELYHGDHLPWTVPFDMISAAPDLGSADGDLPALITCLEDRSPGVIIIDTVAQTLGSAEENGAGMIQLIANAQALSEKFECLVLLIHHAGLTETDRLRGHSSLGCALDALVYFERREGTLSAIMKVQKIKEEDDAGLSFEAQLVRVVIGNDEDGDEISTLVVESVRKVETAAAKPAKAPPRQQRLLMSVIDAAIAEAGFSFKPLADGPMVQGVKDGIARDRYYARIAEPRDDDDLEKAAARKRQAWHRTVKAALDAKDLMAAERDGERILWKP